MMPSVRFPFRALCLAILALVFSGCASAPTGGVRSVRESRWMRAEYEAGSRRAMFDGVVVYLDRSPTLASDGRTVCPANADLVATEAPLLFPRRVPLATNRAFRVFLDPGHGGSDTGALSPDRSVCERDLVTDLVRRIGARLEGDDRFLVSFTRTESSQAVSLAERAKKAAGADLFVSVHLNATVSESPCGAECYRCTPVGFSSTGAAKPIAVGTARPGNACDGENLRLAFCLQRALLRRTHFADRGVRNAQYAVLCEATVPAALVECGFLTNDGDRALLQSEKGRERIARGIADGIRAFCLGGIAE